MIDADMPRATIPRPQDVPDSGIAFLVEIVRSGGVLCASPGREAHDRLLALAAAWRPAASGAADVVGRACARTPPDWHLSSLLASLSHPELPDDATAQARRLYHARWLGHLLMPDRPEFRPLVTILIPVYNRAAMAAEAVESCLAQTWRPLEILVVDDGSTDDLADALARFGGAVRIARQSNGGVSRARNAGIRLAKGDFVHFLDSDNLLLPTAVAQKVDGFAHIPDAGLCYSLAEVEGHRPRKVNIPAPDGSADCPTTTLLTRELRYPFYVSCVMMPRFGLLESGGFEEDLRRLEDTRFWIKLALRGTKAIGLSARLTVRRLVQGSLSEPQVPPHLRLTTQMRTVADCLAHRHAWPMAACKFPSLLRFVLEHDVLFPLPEGLQRDAARLLGVIEALAKDNEAGGASPLLLLAHLRDLTRYRPSAEHPHTRAQTAFLSQISAATDRAIAGAGALTAQDVSFWMKAASPARSGRRLVRFLRRVEQLMGRDPFAVTAVDEVLRAAPRLPGGRTTRTYVRLRKWLPKSVALWLALGKMRRDARSARERG